VRVIDDQVMAREVDLETDNCRFLVMHGELEDTPGGFSGSNVTGVDEVGHLIALLKLDGRTIRTLVCVFRDVLCSGEGHDTFDIHVSIVTENGEDAFEVSHESYTPRK
jgi:hypothetical protein